MTETESRVIATIGAVFANKGVPVPHITPETLLDRSLGLASIDFAELVVRLEREFKTDPFSAGAISAIRTVRDLASLYQDAATRV